MTAVESCRYISSEVKKSPFYGKYHNQLLLSNTIGKPTKQPTPFIKPLEVVYDKDKIMSLIENCSLTWLELQSTSRYGVYHTVVALFGDKYWLFRDSIGCVWLAIYGQSFLE